MGQRDCSLKSDEKGSNDGSTAPGRRAAGTHLEPTSAALAERFMEAVTAAIVIVFCTIRVSETRACGSAGPIGALR